MRAVYAADVDVVATSLGSEVALIGGLTWLAPCRQQLSAQPRLWRVRRVVPGSWGRVGECFHYIGVFQRLLGSGDVGLVPGGGVDVESSEDVGLEGVAAGDEVDAASGGVDGDGMDAAEFS